jgi:NAD(P)-dependent dehydrogenase (short-subunit alcohol dehydrogenase family)
MRASDMTQSKRDAQPSAQDVALIVGGGPGISSSCARLFATNGMRVAVAARNSEKPALEKLEKMHGVRRFACDASEPAAVEQLFKDVVQEIGTPRLVVHNIDGRVPGIFRKSVIEADPLMAFETLRNSAFSALLVGQQAARLMLGNKPDAYGAKGTIIFTNASAALKGFPLSGAFAMACHAKSGLAQSMARELMPQGIHVANVPIDAAIGWTQEDGTRAHRLAGTTVNDNMADPDHIAETYLQLYRQHRSTWAFEVVLRPWVEKW